MARAGCSSGPTRAKEGGGGCLEDADEAEVRPYWSGYVLPLVGANSVDGFGLGLGGELFQRPHRGDHGYKLKITASTYETVTLAYTSQYGQLEIRGDNTWIVRGGYQTWNDLPYGGVGGADVATLWAPEVEGGNRIRAPYAMLAAARRMAPESPWRGYAQAYLHPAWVEPAPGGLMARGDAFGAGGGWYGDLGIGVELDTTDQWPLPNAGTRAEVAARVGGTVADGEVAPLAGAYAEAIHWVPVVRDRLVIGFRGQAEKTVGPRPLWEQSVAGGRWRDELGFEQALSGYGRLRTRGDGLVTAEIEVRPHLFTWTLPWFTLDFYGSLYAELGWLFADWDPGPPLPTVGFGPEILYQRASQLRPFVAWGWRSDVPGGPRRAVPILGLSVMDPL